jgi:nucleoid DNA-binding protein
MFAREVAMESYINWNTSKRSAHRLSYDRPGISRDQSPVPTVLDTFFGNRKTNSLAPVPARFLESFLLAKGISMTKKEIARMISEEVGLTNQKTLQVVQRLLDVVIEVLANEGQVELRNFGVFKIKIRSSRTGRNPKTGEPIIIPERSNITFKAGKEMEERVEQYKSRRTSRFATPEDSRDHSENDDSQFNPRAKD